MINLTNLLLSCILSINTPNITPKEQIETNQRKILLTSFPEGSYEGDTLLFCSRVINPDKDTVHYVSVWGLKKIGKGDFWWLNKPDSSTVLLDNNYFLYYMEELCLNKEAKIKADSTIRKTNEIIDDTIYFK